MDDHDKVLSKYVPCFLYQIDNLVLHKVMVVWENMNDGPCLIFLELGEVSVPVW